MKLLLLNIVVLILLSSCSAEKFLCKKMDERNDKVLTRENINSINGVYVNPTKTLLKYYPDYSIWKSLFVHSKMIKAKDSVTVKLEVKSKNKLEAILFVADPAIDKAALRYKLKNNYVKIRSQLSARCVIGPLLWPLHNRKVFLSITPENNLVLINITKTKIMFLCIPVCGMFYIQVPEYNRIE